MPKSDVPSFRRWLSNGWGLLLGQARPASGDLPDPATPARGRTPGNNDARDAFWYRENPSPLFALKDGATIASVNRFGAGLLGTTEGALSGEPFLKFVHEADRTAVQDALNGCVQQPQQAHRFQFRALRQDGRILWIEAVARGVVSPGGELHVLLAGDDSTERRQAEQKLLEYEETYRALYGNSPILVQSIDRTGRLVSVSSSWLEALGYERKEVIGRRSVEFMTPESRKYSEETIQPEFFRTGVAKDIAYQFVKKNGEIIDVLLSSTAERNPDGSVARSLAVLIDVTEQTQGQKALQETQALLQQVIDSIPLSLSLRDVDGRLQMVNRAMAAQWGLLAVEMVGQHVMELPAMLAAPRTEQDRIRETDALVMDGVQGIEYAMERSYPTGRRWMRVMKGPVRDSSGAITSVLTLAEDITGKRLAEQQLQNSQRLLQTAIDTIPHDLFVKDREGRFVAVNKRMAETFGRRPDEILGRMRAYEGPASEHVTIAEADRQVLEQGTVSDQIQSRTVPDGRTRQFHVIKSPTRDDRGQVTGLVGIAEDITDQLEAQQQLRDSQRLLQTAIDTIPHDLFVKDRLGRFVAVNKRMAETFGRRPDEILGRMRAHEGPAAEHETIAESDRLVMEQGTVSDQIQSRTVPDGRTRKFHVIKSPVRDEQGQVTGLVGIAEDITDQLAAEQALNLAQKMEAIGQLTGGIAHDFNNLLTAIQGAAEVLLTRIAADPQGVAAAHMIDAAVQRGATLTQRLLAYARRQALQPVALDLNKVISSVDMLLRRTLGEHIDIEVVAGGGLWKTLADPSQVESALLNLAVNARDAMPDGGHLTLETANAHLDDEYALAHGDVRPGQYVLLCVTDTGIGMPPEVLARAFDPFYTTKAAGKGSGLGLSMVYGFVKQSGGHVKIYSEPGQGTTVKIYLPRDTGIEAAPGPVQVETDPLPGGSEVILVVEDDDLVRANAIGQLESLGYRVLAAADSKSALAVLSGDERVDLLFSDVVIPGGMNGRQVAEEGKRMRPELRVLFCSGYSENAIVHHGRLDPGVRLLPKPYRKVELARRVRRTLDAPA